MLTIKELYEVCKDAINKGYGDKVVLFDTEAMCFDIHLVPIKSAWLCDCFENNHFDSLVLNWSGEEISHYNID
jgi:hypothetical protein